MYEPAYPLFPILSFIGFVVALIPLPWHLQAWNSGTCFYMAWASIACLNQFVNSVVWANDAINQAPIWCEISIRIMLGASVGLPAASLCINRRLYHIANVQSVSISRPEKSRDIFIDTVICVLFPLIFVAAQYIVQGHRFNIFENIGCYPAIYNTILTPFISGLWPIIIGLVSATYCAFSLHAFARHRLEFNHFLATNKSLTLGRYFRLMALAMTEILFTVPLASFLLWLNITATPIEPWKSWSDTHYNYSRVDLYPAALWRNGNRNRLIAIEVSRWAAPACALIFFCYFGFTEEAKRNYRVAFWSVLRFLGLRRIADIGAPRVLPILPVKVPLSSLPSHYIPHSTSTFAADLKRFDDSFMHDTTTFSSPSSTKVSFSRCSMDTLVPSGSIYDDHDNAKTTTLNPVLREAGA